MSSGYGPTVEDCNDSNSEDNGVVFEGRGESRYNTNARRKYFRPSTGTDIPSPQLRNIDQKSDSGYSSYTAASLSEFTPTESGTSKQDRRTSQVVRRLQSDTQPAIDEDAARQAQPRVQFDLRMQYPPGHRRSPPPRPVVTQALPSTRRPQGVPQVLPPFEPPPPRTVQYDDEFNSDAEYDSENPTPQRPSRRIIDQALRLQQNLPHSRRPSVSTMPTPVRNRNLIVVGSRGRGLRSYYHDNGSKRTLLTESDVRDGSSRYSGQESRQVYFSEDPEYPGQQSIIQPAISRRRPTVHDARSYTAPPGMSRHEEQQGFPNLSRRDIDVASPMPTDQLFDAMRRREAATDEHINAIHGSKDTNVNQSYGIGRMPSRVAPTPQIRKSNKENQSAEENSEVRLKVDGNKPLSLYLNGELEGRTMALLPLDENGMAELIIRGKNRAEKEYFSEKYSTKGANRIETSYMSGNPNFGDDRRTIVSHPAQRASPLFVNPETYQRPPSPDFDRGSHGRTHDLTETHILKHAVKDLEKDWKDVWIRIPDVWKWDLEHHNIHCADGGRHGCWTCTPLESDKPKTYPLTVASCPVVLPVEYQWPPSGGLNPPPDPRPSAPIDCRNELPLDVIRDIFLTFESSIGFYILISGLIQFIVPEDFDTEWASSHLPHKYGGLKVCYIQHPIMEPTMLPSTTEIARPASSPYAPIDSSLSHIFQRPRTSATHSKPSLKINDFIEVRPISSYRKERYSGRIGLRLFRENQSYLLMSTHIITEAIMVKSHREAIFRRTRNYFEKLNDDWNEHVEIWAGNEKAGVIHRTFDSDAEIYPNGFRHDVTLMKTENTAAVRDIVSPVENMGWLDRESWTSLRQQTSTVKILGPTEEHRATKSIKCSRPSEILVVGEGIFRNHTVAAGSKPPKDHDMSTWKDLVSRALLYRVHPDFDPPNGYSGIALYADGVRHDGTEGPGIVGFQSFVQRSGHVQNFEMEGTALDRRLQLGRIAFYGAFEVPDELKRNYTIA